MPLFAKRLGAGTAALLLIAGAVAGCGKNATEREQAHIAKGDAFVAQKQFNEATLEYRLAIHENPTSERAYYQLGEAYAAKSDVRNALQAYLRAADLNPRHVDAQLKAGNLLLLARRYDDVKTRARALLKDDPKNAQALLMLGNALAGLKSLDEAVAANERAAALAPQSNMFLNLGTLKFIAGNQKEAEQAFLKAVDVAPDSVDAQVGLAVFYLAAGRQAEAEPVLMRAVTLDPNNVSANKQLAALYLVTGRPDQAETLLKHVVGLVKDPAAKIALSDFYLARGRVGEAVATLEELATQKGDFAAAQLRIALIHYTNDHRSEATAAIDKVLQQDPKNATALALRAHVRLDDHRLPDAEAAANAAMASDASSVRANFAKGKVLHALGRTEEARTLFREVIRLDPDAGEGYLELAQLALDGQEIESAIQFAQQAATLMPSDLDAQVVLARTLMVRSQDRTRAENLVASLVRRLPTSARVQMLRGELAAAHNDLATARAAFESATAKDPTSVEAVRELVTMDVRAQKFDSARMRADLALAKAPNSPQLLVLAGRAHAAANDNRKAEELFRKAIAVDSGNLDAYTSLAGLYLIDRRLKEARTEFQEIASRQPQSVAPPIMIGIISEAMGDRATAATWYANALRIDGRSGPAANNLAWIYAERGEKLETAQQLAETAYASLASVPEVMDTLGWVYYKRDMLGLALPHLRRASEQDPTNPQYLYHLGMLYAKNGDEAKARSTLQRALAMRGNFEGATEARAALASLLY